MQKTVLLIWMAVSLTVNIMILEKDSKILLNYAIRFM